MVWVRRGSSLLLAVLLMILAALGSALLAVRLQLGGDLTSVLQKNPVLASTLADGLREDLAQRSADAALPEEYWQSLPLDSLAPRWLSALLAGEDTAFLQAEAERMFGQQLRDYALHNGFVPGPVLDAAVADFAARAAGSLQESLAQLLSPKAGRWLAQAQRWLLYGLCGAIGLGLILALPLIWLNRRQLRFLGWGAAVLLGGGGLLMGAAAVWVFLPPGWGSALPSLQGRLAEVALQRLADVWRLWAAILLLGGVLLATAAFLLRIERVRTLFFDKKFLLFLLVGVVNTFNGVFFSWLFSLRIEPEVAFVFGYAAGLCIGYLLNSALVFHESLSVGRLCKFALSYLPNFLIQFVMVLVLMTWLGLPKLLAYGLAAAIGMPVTFLLLKLFAFAKPERK